MNKVKFEYIDLSKLNTDKEPYKYIDMYKKAEIELILKYGVIENLNINNLFSLFALTSSCDHIYYYGWGMSKIDAQGRVFLFNADNISSDIFISVFGKDLKEETNE